MKSIKAAIAAIATLASTIAFGGGLYIVSGGDFRDSRIKYVIETTNDNQEVEITPYSVTTLASAGTWANNLKRAGEWSVKTDGKEFVFGQKTLIRKESATPGTTWNLGTNITPMVYTYPKAGLHTVKVFDEKCNIYELRIYSPDMVSLYVDWRDIPSGVEFPSNMKIQLAAQCKKLRSVFWAPWDNNNAATLPHFGSTNLVSCILPNSEVFKKIDANALSNCKVTNDFTFASVTNVGSWALSNSPYIQYVSFPNIRYIGAGVCNNHKFSSSLHLGLRKLRIGDTLEYLDPTNAFYLNPELKIIEFVTDQEDFVAAWNNHAIFPNWLGTAEKTGTDGEDEATITPIADG